MVQSSDLYAVVMGDLVHSEASPSPDALHKAFNRVVEAENARAGSAIVSPLTITLGDEFQGLLSSLTEAAQLVRSLRFGLLAEGIDCRFVIGQARIETPVNRERAWNMMGPGLARARETLDEKTPGLTYRFTLMEAALTEHLLEAVGAGLAVIERDWTERQREDIEALLAGQSVEEIAGRRGVTVHSVYKVRAAGDYDAYRLQWAAVEAALGAIDTGDVA
ncbi:MAG: SatD family protein [Pseudomonadota bacterium]|nr:SatD family protein [Pseudomonadota bacterium]